MLCRHSESRAIYSYSIRKFDFDPSPKGGCSAVWRVIDRFSRKMNLIWKSRAKRVHSPRQDPSALAFSSAEKAKCQ